MHPRSSWRRPTRSTRWLLVLPLALGLLACSDADRTRWAARFGSAESQHAMGSRHESGNGVEQDAALAIEWYEKAAEQGHAPSRTRLVEIYEERGAPDDAERALHWLEALAEDGDAEGQYRYSRRLAESGDETAGKRWLEAAAEAGHPRAQVALARWHLELGVKREEAVALLQAAAREGDPDAAFELAGLAEDGVVSISDEEVEALVLAAAENGHAGAQYAVAEQLATSDEPEWAEAAKWYRKAAKQDFAAAQEALGILYESGKGVTTDPLEAARWYRLAADQDRPTAQNQLARLHAGGLLPDDETADQIALLSAATGDNSEALERISKVARANNDRRAVEWYRRAIEHDYAPSMINLAKMMEEDRVPGSGREEATALYRRAAEQGHPVAQSLMAQRYSQGVGVEQDTAASIEMLEAAARGGHGPSQAALASAYLQGLGGEPDLARAAQWYGRAVESGVEEAEVNYATMLAAGAGIEKDDEAARVLFERAAARGDTSAQFALGSFYEEGRGGLPKDARQAVNWWRKAAKQGQPLAQAKLGMAMVSGQGTSRNLVDGYAWLVVSDVEEVAPLVSDMEKAMPDVMKAQAKRLIEERRALRETAKTESE